MGSCISKCKPKKKLKEDISHVQDKLVISQDPISSIPLKMTIIPSEILKPLSPAPSSSSTASFASFSCSTNTSKFAMPSSSSSSASLSASSSSCSSSLLSSKDRSFSNEFLWSCVKDNPHIISLDPKAINEKDHEKPFVSANKIQYYPQNLNPPSLVASPLVKTKQSIQEKATVKIPTPKKRARASSPTLVRQKSFRKEQNYNPILPNRALRSPSPSRRFNNGDNGRYVPTNGTNENNSYRRQIVSKGNNVVNSCPKRESFRVASPNRDLTIGRNFSVRKKDTLISQQVSAKIDDHVAVGDIKDRQEMDIVMEDINNPLIALDCFIFL